MTRPSGICEGLPCYTEEDVSGINIDIAIWQGLVDQYQAQLDAATANLEQYQMELTQAQTQACP